VTTQADDSTPAPKQGPMRIAMLGNPNAGKSTLFNALTGLRQKIANYPGVTIEKHVGMCRVGDRELELIDLPGTYSLAPTSPDELVATRMLVGSMKGEAAPDALLLVVAAHAVERALFLATQATEFGVPAVIALTMSDIAERQGVSADADALSKELNLPVVRIDAPRGEGLEALLGALVKVEGAKQDVPRAQLPAELKVAAESLAAQLSAIAKARGEDASSTQSVPVHPAEAVRVLVRPGGYTELDVIARLGESAAPMIAEARATLESLDPPAAKGEASARAEFARTIAGKVMKHTTLAGESFSARVDRVLTHRVFGTAIFFVLMAVVFQSVFQWAGPFMGWIEGLFGWIGGGIDATLDEGPLHSLISAAIIDGVGGVLVFLPQILILFFFIALLEDSGYLSRAAYLMDRVLSKVGLSGRSFIPMLSGFACAIPGVMATRTIPDRATRFTTMMVTPLMSCSARLPVYVLLIEAFIPDSALFSIGGWDYGMQGFVMLCMYLVGALAAIPVALLMRKFMFKGAKSFFMMELPAYKLPRFGAILRQMFDRGKVFVVNAGTIIFAMAILIWALGYFPHNEEVAAHAEQQREVVATIHGELETLEEQAEAFAKAENAVLIKAGVDKKSLDDEEARDTAIQSLSGDHERDFLVIQSARAPVDEALELYTAIDNEEAEEQLEQSFLGRMGHGVEPIFQPLGWDWRISTAAIASFPAREVVIGAMGTIFSLGGDQNEESQTLRETLQNAKREDGTKLFTIATALSLMVFFALCMQCGASVAAIKREANSWKWAAFSFTYMTVLAWIASAAVYQIGTACGL